jgi:hypothetical protein
MWLWRFANVGINLGFFPCTNKSFSGYSRANPHLPSKLTSMEKALSYRDKIKRVMSRAFRPIYGYFRMSSNDNTSQIIITFVQGSEQLEPSYTPQITMAHGFMLVMGGFVYEDEDARLHPIHFNYEHYYEHWPHKKKKLKAEKAIIPFYNNPHSSFQSGIIRRHSSSDDTTSDTTELDLIADVPEAEIAEKSAGDGLSKLLAMIQVGWFIIQCVGRIILGLSITELETITVAYAIVNLVVFVVWWDKPLRVDRQCVLYSLRVPGMTDGPTEPRRTSERGVPKGRILKAVRVLDSAWRSVVGFVGSVNYGTWDSADKVELLWAGEEGDGYESGLSGIVALFVAAVFGAIHCAAWHAHFSTVAERWLWRTSAMAITFIPLLIIALLVKVVRDREKSTRSFQWENRVMMTILFPFPLPYVLCRLILLVLPVIQLRSLPPDAFTVVPWSTFIPHI